MDRNRRIADISGITDCIEKLWVSKKYSDLTLTCRGAHFNVHCAVVCTQSSVFAAAIDGGFQESMTKEIDLPDDDPEIISALLDFLYTGHYDDTHKLVEKNPQQAHTFATEQPMNPNALMFDVKMYIAGDKYRIPYLKEIAKLYYETIMALCWDSNAFSESMLYLWENTVESDVALKRSILRFVAINVGEQRSEFLDVVRSHGDLAVDVLLIVAEHLSIANEKVKREGKWAGGSGEHALYGASSAKLQRSVPGSGR